MSERGKHGAGEFGPRGYLPERAAKRARKIVLREQMSVGWPLAALAAALLVAVAGAAYLLAGDRPPGPPFVPVAPLSAVDPAGVEVFGHAALPDVLVVRAGGPPRAFVAPDAPVRYCPDARVLVTQDGRAWERNGRLVAGRGESLQPLRIAAHDGVVYVDADARPAAPPPRPSSDSSAC